MRSPSLITALPDESTKIRYLLKGIKTDKLETVLELFRGNKDFKTFDSVARRVKDTVTIQRAAEAKMRDLDEDWWVIAVIRSPHFDPDLFEIFVLGRAHIELAHIDNIRRFDWSFRPGNRVVTKLEDESEWHPGTVTADKENKRFSIRCDDGDFTASPSRDEMIFIWAFNAFALP